MTLPASWMPKPAYRNGLGPLLSGGSAPVTARKLRACEKMRKQIPARSEYPRDGLWCSVYWLSRSLEERATCLPHL